MVDRIDTRIFTGQCHAYIYFGEQQMDHPTIIRSTANGRRQLDAEPGTHQPAPHLQRPNQDTGGMLVRMAGGSPLYKVLYGNPAAQKMRRDYRQRPPPATPPHAAPSISGLRHDSGHAAKLAEGPNRRQRKRYVDMSLMEGVAAYYCRCTTRETQRRPQYRR